MFNPAFDVKTDNPEEGNDGFLEKVDIHDTVSLLIVNYLHYPVLGCRYALSMLK